LAHARRLFTALGDPQNRAPVVHVVGTAGKGTIAHLVTSRLLERGHSVATHMSPHVYDPRERFLIDGSLPDWDDVLIAAHSVDSAAREVMADTGRPPSYFAITAAISWELGRMASTDFSVVEAGIGGRYDATNVIDRSDRILVISAIGLDHVDVLGSTVAEIAEAKVAAARGCAHVVLAPQPDSVARSTVVAATGLLGIDLIEVGSPSGGDWPLEADAVAATVETLVLGSRGTEPMIRSLPPGRLERVSAQDREFVFDGAHNEMKLAGLARCLKSNPGGAPACVIAAVGRGKNLIGCATEIGAIAPVVIATEFDTDPSHPGQGPHSWPAGDLAAAVVAADPNVRTVVASSPAAAVWAAVSSTAAGETIAVTGSFLYLSEIRTAATDKAAGAASRRSRSAIRRWRRSD